MPVVSDSLPVQFMTPEEIEQGILDIKGASDAPFGVNFHMYVPHAEQIVDLCIEHKARRELLALPSAATVERLKAAGIVCIPRWALNATR